MEIAKTHRIRLFLIFGSAVAVLIAAAIVISSIIMPKIDREKKLQRTSIATGGDSFAAVTTDGHVLCSVIGASEDSETTARVHEMAGWTDIVAVSAGYNHMVGLRSDGTVVAAGPNYSGECDVSKWTDIVAVSAGVIHTIGLKRNGTVVACGSNYGTDGDSGGQCDVSDWKNIVAIDAGAWHTVGLKKDGTVVACGDNEYGECDISDWRDIIAISAGTNCTIGLKKDGTVLACGSNVNGQCDVSDWHDIVAICSTDNRSVTGDTYFTIGLKHDGTVVRTSFTNRRALQNEDSFDVSQWTEIVAVDAGYGRILGLKKDGTLVICGVNSLFSVSEMSHVCVP